MNIRRGIDAVFYSKLIKLQGTIEKNVEKCFMKQHRSLCLSTVNSFEYTKKQRIAIKEKNRYKISVYCKLDTFKIHFFIKNAIERHMKTISQTNYDFIVFDAPYYVLIREKHTECTYE